MANRMLLHSSSEISTEVIVDTHVSYEELLASGQMDALVTSAEGSLGPLPVRFLSTELRVSEPEIYRWANRISTQSEVTLVALRSRRPDSRLRGAVLVPYGTATCYKALVSAEHRGLPYHDFYYNVTFEALAYGNRNWGSTRFVTNHLSGSGQPFHGDIAACQCEALAHFVHLSESPKVERLTFAGCCMRQDDFLDLNKMKPSFGGGHYPIKVTRESLPGNNGHVVLLNWAQAVRQSRS